MSTYVNQESLIKAMEQTPFTMAECETPEWCRAANWARMNYIKALKMLPPEDVEEVRHGRWEVGGMFDDIGRCSACHYMFPIDTATTEFHYCPNCGAKMDGLVEEG